MSRQTARGSQAARDHVERILSELHERNIERELDIIQYSNVAPHEIDDESTDTPLMDPFRELGGLSAIKDMTNFSLQKFNTLWLSLREHVLAYYNVGRGKRSDVKPKDAFFMTLVMLKEGGTWDSNAKRFKLATTTFTDVVTKFIRMLSPRVYVDLVEERCDEATMRNARTRGTTFSHSPSAFIAENGKFYSGKHGLYGLKVEVSVDKRGIAINCSQHVPGATHDITIFKGNKEFHNVKMKKLPGDEMLPDDCPLAEVFPAEWAILADKVYQGINSFLRGILPKKGRNISLADLSHNDKVAHDRVIVENFFGRLNQLWRITSDKFRLGRDLIMEIGTVDLKTS
ncbi:hypothetical protein F442_01677 [Phytophthora nicotianae P10297]|uniref:DDE Tnp4 domain-containing protein n=1 Tax=Phytophthora nicotianae P10297 TaxID=1317064 RepID=W3A1A9_PHYNI|nr:hypothetical protein F442_01677 [Phytophthora nicotianae P10297]